MRNILLFFVLAIALASCDRPQSSEDPGTMALTFRLDWENEPIFMTQRLNYTTNDSFFIDRFSTYLSNISLIGDNGEVVALDIAMLNFSSVSDPLSASTGQTIMLDVPAGHYTAIRFGLGVSASQNAKKPADYPSGNPLASTAEYWDGWESYIFTKVEGKMDLDANGTFESPIAYHMGSDPVFRTKTLNKEMHVQSGMQTNVNFVIHLDKLTQDVNYTTDFGTHAVGDMTLANTIMDNFADDVLMIE